MFIVNENVVENVSKVFIFYVTILRSWVDGFKLYLTHYVKAILIV